jgi:hypothetical protein
VQYERSKFQESQQIFCLLQLLCVLLRNRYGALEEDCGVAVVRAFIPSGRISSNTRGQVVEHELDMNRSGAQPSAASSRLRGWMRWLMPGAHVVAPMRSVDRELEDVWPSGSRQT